MKAERPGVILLYEITDMLRSQPCHGQVLQHETHHKQSSEKLMIKMLYRVHPE